MAASLAVQEEWQKNDSHFHALRVALSFIHILQKSTWGPMTSGPLGLVLIDTKIGSVRTVAISGGPKFTTAQMAKAASVVAIRLGQKIVAFFNMKKAVRSNSRIW